MDWDRADADQKLAALAELPAGHPQLEQLALREPDERVRRKAIDRMAVDALRLVGSVRPEDEDWLAVSLGERIDDGALASGDVVAQLLSAPASFRMALIAHAKSEELAVALAQTLDSDDDRIQVARGRGAIHARAAALRDMRDVELLEAVAREYRDKQRRIYRAARDRADQLLAAREVRRQAEELCDRLAGLLARGELTLTPFMTIEREW